MKIRLWGLLILLALFVQSATVRADGLPPSSYYEGFVYYNEFLRGGGENLGGEYLRGRIDFAVYDTETYEDEFIGAGGYEMPGTGRYVYTYQIFNAPENISNPVAYFAIFGITGDITEDAVDDDSIGAQEDQEDLGGGVEPSEAYFNVDESRVVWEFTPIFISIGGDAENSWFLVFSSDQPWVPGGYEIRDPEGEESEFPVQAPEPATIALLGLGSALVFGRRRKLTR